MQGVWASLPGPHSPSIAEYPDLSRQTGLRTAEAIERGVMLEAFCGEVEPINRHAVSPTPLHPQQPRKTLAFHSPAEVLNDHVALTG